MNRRESDILKPREQGNFTEENVEEILDFEKTISSEPVSSEEDINFVVDVIIRDAEEHSEFNIPDMSREDRKKMVEANRNNFFVIKTLDGKPIGFTDIFTKKVKNTDSEEVTVYKSEISIAENCNKRKKYGTEAMLQLLNKVFDDHPDLENIYATIVETNEASIKFHESLGFSESENVFTPDIVRKGSKKLAISREIWREKFKEIVKILAGRNMTGEKKS